MEGTLLYGLYRYVQAQKTWFSAILVINRVWISYFRLKLGMFFRKEATFLSLSITPSTKALQKLCLGQLCRPQGSYIECQIFGQVINRVGKIADFGHK